jgi:acyl-CoA thioester hydrolase
VSGAPLHTLRVYYEDTDFSGVVYHASYLRFLERGRTELLREIGVHQHALHGASAPVAFAVRAMTIEFLKPAVMDDLLQIETHVQSVGGAQAELAQRVLRDDEVLVTARVKVVAVARGRAVRLPAPLRAAFEALVRDQ